MRKLFLIGAVTATTVAFATEPESEQRIKISANIPAVTIAPRREGRFALQLPGLTYTLTLTMHCDAGWKPSSVSVSIADTGKILTGEQLESGTDVELQLSVPSSQIAPLRIENFCIGSAVDGQLTIPAALSAQASIRCTSESDQKIKYVTKLLAVMLQCGAP